MIRSIEGLEKARLIPGVQEISIVHNIDEIVGVIGNSADRVGFVVAQAETSEKAVAVCDIAMQTVIIKVE